MEKISVPPIQRKEPQIFILLLLVSLASVAAVLFTPSLPEIAQQFGINSSEAQLAMTTFLIGYACGNLPWGPLSNRYGRKPAIYSGILIAIIGSLVILLSGELRLFWLLIVGRFLEAFGSSVGMKITFTIIGDVYSQTTATKKISRAMLSFAIAPGLAIALGGFLTAWLGWKSCFYFLTLYTALIFVLSLFLPETATEIDLEALNLNKMLTAFSQKFKNVKLVVCALLMGCGTSIIYIFASDAPFVGITTIGLTEDEYGLLNFIPPIGMIVGSFFAHWLAGKKDVFFIILLGISVILASSAIMLLLFLFKFVSLYSLFLPMPFIYAGISICSSNASAMAISNIHNKAIASAVINFINVGLSVVALFLLQAFPKHDTYILPLFLFGIGIVMLILRLRFLKT